MSNFTFNLKPLAIALYASFFLAFLDSSSVNAHQSVNPNILKLIGKAPLGTPSCYVNGKATSECIEKGRKLFETGTFGGNGRTCATCHPANNNFTIDVPYIKKLPTTDKLFVNEQIAALAELETPLLRKYGLICENLDGFGSNGRGDNNKRNCVMRSVIATEGLVASTSPDPFVSGGTDLEPKASGFTPNRPAFPLKGALGWAGDGSPGEGSLRNFAIGAVIQHFPKTLNRVEGVDFVIPTEDQLDAMEAFQLSLGRRDEMNLNPDPTQKNKAFNCLSFTGNNACSGAITFKLQKRSELNSWMANNFPGTNPVLEFNDEDVTNGQILFFGGIPSLGAGTPNIRTCSGCHVQAGAGSSLAVNIPQTVPVGNRQRSTGTSFAANSPICLNEAQNVIYNSDGGFGAGPTGFPLLENVGQDCTSSFQSSVEPKKSCFKEFSSTTQPPLSNSSFSGSLNADVGGVNVFSRRAICGSSVPDDSVYMIGTGFFSTPSVIEAASTIPLFHNNIAATVEDAVQFYASMTFNESASGAENAMVVSNVEDQNSKSVNVVSDIGAFLRAINAINNLKISARYISSAIDAYNVKNNSEKVRNAKLGLKRASDAIAVLTVGGPTTSNYLGGPKNLFSNAPSVFSSIQTAKNKLTLYGNSDAGFGKLSITELTNAQNQIASACRAMLRNSNNIEYNYCP